MVSEKPIAEKDWQWDPGSALQIWTNMAVLVDGKIRRNQIKSSFN